MRHRSIAGGPLAVPPPRDAGGQPYGVAGYYANVARPGQGTLPPHLYQPVELREFDHFGSTGLDSGGAWTVLYTLDNLTTREGYVRLWGWDEAGATPPARSDVQLRIRKHSAVPVPGYNEIPGDGVGTRSTPSAAVIDVSSNTELTLEARLVANLGVGREAAWRLYGWFN